MRYRGLGVSERSRSSRPAAQLLALLLLPGVAAAQTNRPPVAQPDSAATSEDVAITIVVTANDSDPDGDPVNLAINTPILEFPTLGTATRLSGSSIRYTPNPNAFGTDQFRYRITDGRGGLGSAIVTVTINEVNDPPVANPDAAVTTEDVAVTINVTANDTDADGNAVTLIGSPVITPPAHGSAVKISGTSITYTPAANFSGSDTFQYEVGDGRGARSRAWVTVTVNGVNDPPTAVNDSASTNEDTAVSIVVTANDFDPEGTVQVAINVPILEHPTRGTAVRVNSSTIRYTPNPNTFGSDQFKYRITDGNGALGSAYVFVNVVSVNDPPVAVADSATTPAGTAVTVNVTANDTDVETGTPTLITQPIVTPPANGTAVKISGSSITYTPAAGFSGSDTFQYEVGDGAGARSRAWVTVTVTNNPPVAQPDSATTNEDAAVTINVTANDSDPDGNVVRVAVTTPILEPPTRGTATRVSDTSILYTPNANASGSDQFRYRISDGNGGLASALVTVTIVEINDQPSAQPDAATTPEETAVTINVTANDNDVDGDPVTLITAPIITPPAHGTAVKVSGTSITYTPEAEFAGTDTFQYEAGDGRGARSRAWVTVTVTSVNDPPVAAPDSATTAEDTAVTIDVTANDSDPEGATVRVATATPILEPPTRGTAVRASDTSILYTPNANAHGSDQFRYRITDGAGGLASALVTVTITAVNDPPTAVDDEVSGHAGEPILVSVTVNDSDVDGDPVTLITQPVVTPPAHGVAARLPGQQVIQYVSEAGYVGGDSFQYEVGDGHGARSRAWVHVGIGNERPVAVADAAETHADTPVVIAVTANDSDPDGDPVTLIGQPVITPPGHGTAVKISGAEIRYTPAAGYLGPDSFEYEIGDGHGSRARAWVTLEVTNDPPLARNDGASTARGEQVTINVTANDADPDGDPVALTANPLLTLPAHGNAVRVSNSSIRYTPNATFVGVDRFRYQIEDPYGLRHDAEVAVTVTETPPPEIESIDPEHFDHGTVTVVTLSGLHLQGATASIGTLEPASPGRVFPTAEVIGVDPQGRWVQVEIDATAAGVEGFYSLAIETPAGKKPYPFRVIPDRPVVDAWTPSELNEGNVYVMAVAGFNLAGASVELSAPGIQIIGLNNDSDRLLAGLLHVPGGMPGNVDITVRRPGGGQTTVPMAVRAAGQAAGRPTRVVQEAAEGQPEILLQEPSVASSPGGAEGFRSQSEALSSVQGAFDFCFTFEYRVRYTEFAVLLELFDEVTLEPLAQQVFSQLRPNSRLNFGAKVFAVWATLEFSIQIRICDGGIFDVLFCVRAEFGFMIPLAGGQSFYFDACTGSSQWFAYGASGFLLNYHWRSSNECVQGRDLDPTSQSGLRSAEVEVGDCCGQTSTLSAVVQGEVFDVEFGGEVPVAEISPFCVADQTNDFTIEVRAFIPVNHAGSLNPFDTCLSNLGTGRMRVFGGDERSFDPNPHYKPLAPLLPESFRMLQERVLVPEQALDFDGEIPEGRYAIAGKTLTYADTVIVPLAGDNRIDPHEFDWPDVRDCFHFHDYATANPQRTYDPVERLAPNKVRARMTMAGNNPLSFGSPDIDWDVTVTLEKPDANTLRWEVTAIHDCIPAYEVYINDHFVYGFMPPIDPDGTIPATRFLACLPWPMDVEETRTGTIPLGQ